MAAIKRGRKLISSPLLMVKICRRALPAANHSVRMNNRG